MTNIILRGCNGKMGQVITNLVESDDDAIIV
ncbi:MAG TPA: 4-hydroxy-tetrahydrodipicolinate reductase, partial [Lachnospiraceae bacterium]|nr:4-hydroxy-tetrahydrodipicolinate reductase [Lachnospiraceae bacterium]